MQMLTPCLALFSVVAIGGSLWGQTGNPSPSANTPSLTVNTPSPTVNTPSPTVNTPSVAVNEMISDVLDFSRDVQPVLTRYCAGCHNASDHEADVLLHDGQAFAETLSKKKILLGKSASDSHLFQLMNGSLEPKMPPKEEPQPTPSELETVRLWIDQGAVLPLKNLPLREKLKVAKRVPDFQGTQPISALGISIDHRWLIGYQDRVAMKRGQWTSNLDLSITGKVSQIRFTPDSKYAVIAAGIPGVGGQATVLRSTERGFDIVRSVEGHADTLYSAVLSPDHRTLATAGYDKKILLWDLESGKLVRSLEGHNGAVYDLDFDSSSLVLASASADETIKIWNVTTGERLDTYGQCEAEQYIVRFAPDDPSGQRVIAAGADRRIRVWKLLSKSKPSVSPMLQSVFAHEGSVLAFAFQPTLDAIATAGEDKKVKLWSYRDLSPLGEVGSIEDVPSALLWDTPTKIVCSGLDGKMYSWDVPKLHDQSGAPTHSIIPSSSHASQALSNDPNAIPEVIEIPEPRGPLNPQKIPTIARVSGVLALEDMRSESSGDWYQFEAKSGETLQIAIESSRSGSPMDSQIDVFDERANPVLRTRLQAIRESYFTFRGKDSTIADDFRMHRWEDMELNEYLYAGGEVVRLWLYPRGPDSGFKVYPGQGNRYTYFDTTATTHALNEPAWIVRELGKEEKSVPNGLPVFPIYYSNDDESSRKFGKDSQLTFTAPFDGSYLLRVRDTRGLAGDKFTYRLTLLRPDPRFTIRLEQKEVQLRPGVGSEFSLLADRYDGLDGEVHLHVEGLPAGVTITSPLSIEADQIKGIGTLFVSEAQWDSVPQEFQITLLARATTREGVERSSDTLTMLVKRSDKKAPLRLKVVGLKDQDDAPPASEIIVCVGETRSAKLVIDRGELQGDIAFGGDDSGRNLPHGVYVDNIGLNGLLIPAGQTTREVFITVAPWVREQTRVFHLRANVDGNPTTLPIKVKVVKDDRPS